MKNNLLDQRNHVGSEKLHSLGYKFFGGCGNMRVSKEEHHEDRLRYRIEREYDILKRVGEPSKRSVYPIRNCK